MAEDKMCLEEGMRRVLNNIPPWPFNINSFFMESRSAAIFNRKFLRDKSRKPPHAKQNGTIGKPDVSEELQQLRTKVDSHKQEERTLRAELASVTLAFDGMSIVTRYLTEQMDAFSCPSLKCQIVKLLGEVKEAKEKIDELSDQKNRAEGEVIALNHSHETKLQALYTDHDDELTVIREKLLTDHECELSLASAKHSNELKTLNDYHEERVKNLQAENECECRTMRSNHHSAILVLQKKHDSQMEELHQQHQKELIDVSQRFESIKHSLSEKIDTLRCECDDLRNRARVSEEALLRESDVKVQVAIAPYLNVAKEVESLKTVLEMKNDEVHHLHKVTIDQRRQLENMQNMEDKIVSLTQKNENLEAIVSLKTDHEKQLNDKYQHLMRKAQRETRANKRLSMEYEEMMWRMTQSDVSSLADNSLDGQRLSASLSYDHNAPHGRTNGQSSTREKSRSPGATRPLSASYERPSASNRRSRTSSRVTEQESRLTEQESRITGQESLPSHENNNNSFSTINASSEDYALVTEPSV